MADYKLNYTAEEVEALLDKVKSGGGLPVVELGDQTSRVLWNDDSVDLTDEEAAQFEVAYQAKTPVIINDRYGGHQVYSLWDTVYSAAAFFAGEGLITMATIFERQSSTQWRGYTRVSITEAMTGGEFMG